MILFVFALVAAGYVLKKGLEKGDRTTHELVVKCIIILTSVVPQQLPVQMAMAVNTALMALNKVSSRSFVRSFVCLFVCLLLTGFGVFVICVASVGVFVTRVACVWCVTPYLANDRRTFSARSRTECRGWGRSRTACSTRRAR